MYQIFHPMERGGLIVELHGAGDVVLELDSPDDLLELGEAIIAAGFYLLGEVKGQPRDGGARSQCFSFLSLEHALPYVLI